MWMNQNKERNQKDSAKWGGSSEGKSAEFGKKKAHKKSLQEETAVKGKIRKTQGKKLRAGNEFEPVWKKRSQYELGPRKKGLKGETAREKGEERKGY